MEFGKRPNSYEQLERLWLEKGDSDDAPGWLVARAILILAAEVRDLANVLDENGKDTVHELEGLNKLASLARMPE